VFALGNALGTGLHFRDHLPPVGGPEFGIGEEGYKISSKRTPP